MIDLESMSLDELKKLQKDVAFEIRHFKNREKKKALAEVEEFARARGLNPADLSELVKRRTRKPAKPKYANPQDPTQTWSGRGRRPRWLDEALSKGKSVEDFAI
ncbi:H-NS histone family protein [Pararhodobacter sp. SW119]|uniref:H-NS histone family protein n=1 Tax=Pararhodobacter sp. SW119 TaxID=2780075 RepID=UPI001AE02FBC|nr:H-NS histone family protein [Pararhodobacter sp. SW119]